MTMMFYIRRRMTTHDIGPRDLYILTKRRKKRRSGMAGQNKVFAAGPVIFHDRES